MRIVWCAFVILLVGGQDANACDKDPNYPDDPNELLRVKWDAVVSVLQNKEIDQKAKESRISKIVSPIFDFPLMARLALGREHWPKFTGPQREKFTDLFVKRLKTSYQEKIALYTDEKAFFKPAVQQKNRKTIRIPMELMSREKEIAVLYKLRKVKNRWKIYDVEIQGVSILLTYRSQFDDILRTGGVEELLARLEEPPSR
jgi:phospholipid transport system substrate-binding protein